MSFPPHVVEAGRAFARDTLAERRRITEELLSGTVPSLPQDPGALASVAETLGVKPEVVAAAITRDPPPGGPEIPPELKALIMARVIDSSEPLVFADQALEAARAVGRLFIDGADTQGTGFMISPELLATAGHVIQEAGDLSKLRVEFRFDQFVGRTAVHAEFKLDPARLLILPDRLDGIDVAIVALGERVGNSTFEPLFWPLTEMDGSAHQTGFHANIIHCPRGVAEMVVRDNWVVVGEDEIHLGYRSQMDTRSSGAPVFNAAWKLIALHVWGETGTDPLIRVTPTIGIADEVNKGVRTSVIHNKLRQLQNRTTVEKDLLDQVLK